MAAGRGAAGVGARDDSVSEDFCQLAPLQFVTVTSVNPSSIQPNALANARGASKPTGVPCGRPTKLVLNTFGSPASFRAPFTYRVRTMRRSRCHFRILELQPLLWPRASVVW